MLKFLKTTVVEDVITMEEILVAEDVNDIKSYRAFTATGRQGVNYARNVWHHPLLVMDADSRFIVVDRKGPGNNLEEVWFAEDFVFSLTP